MLKKIFIFLCFFNLISCGKKSVQVVDLKLTSETAQNELLVGIEAEIKMGSLSFSRLELPIIHPRSRENIGNVKLYSHDGKNQLEVNFNFTQLAELDLENLKLPNGGSIPLRGQSQGIKIPLGRGVELYLIPVLEELMVGVSFPFKQLDSLGSQIGESALFPNFEVKGIQGAIGLYTSRLKGKNGIGFFADLSYLKNQMSGQEPVDSGPRIIEISSQIESKVKAPSEKQYEMMNKELLNLHRKRARLSVR
jgi:hypothetical protein